MVAQSLGIRDLRYHLDLFGGGSGSHQVLMHAAMAVATGAAEVVVVLARDQRALRVPHGRDRACRARHARVPVPGARTATRRLRSSSPCTRARTWHEYGVTAEHLGARRDRAARLRGTQRAGDDAHPAHDGRLPRVALDRRAVPALRLLPRDRRRRRARRHDARAGARPAPAAGADRGRGERRRPHAVLEPARRPRDDRCSRRRAPPVRDRGDRARRRSTSLELYDAFTPLVLLQLEDYGFCKKGEAGPLVASGATALRRPAPRQHPRRPPVGGLRPRAQPRGRGGRRSCGATPASARSPGAEVALSTGQPGYVAGSTGAVIWRRPVSRAVPSPVADRDSTPWWAALGRHELTLQRCDGCDAARGRPGRSATAAARSSGAGPPASGRGTSRAGSSTTTRSGLVRGRSRGALRRAPRPPRRPGRHPDPRRLGRRA